MFDALVVVALYHNWGIWAAVAGVAIVIILNLISLRNKQ